MDIKLKFERSVVKEDDRTWVNKDKFPEFESEYQHSQDDSSLTNTSNVQFGIHINMKDSKGKKIPQNHGFRLRPCMAVSTASNCLLSIGLLRRCMRGRTVIMKYYQ